MKIKNGFYGLLTITSVIIFSTASLQAATHSSALFRTDSESNFIRRLSIQTLADIELPCLTQAGYSDSTVIITTFSNYLKPVSSPCISLTSHDGDNTVDNISKGNVASSPEPVTLLLLGAGLMGIALYRKLKNK